MKRRPLPPVREETTANTWKTLCENDWAIYTLVASVSALTYANSLHGDFVHDDIPAIVGNGDVNGGNSVLGVFGNDFWGTPMSDATSHKSYRPLTTLSFRLNYKLCGRSPWWWHACNIALHATCCMLVARAGAVVAKLQRPFAALAALLFAVHPVHTEAVAGVVGRADVLACVFFLTSILLYHGTNNHRVWGSVAAGALSMLAKETGLTALLFNAALDLYRCWAHVHRSSSAVKWRWKDSPYGRAFKTLAALSLLAGARLALLQGSLPAFSPQDNPPAFHPSFAVRLMTFCYLAAFNWWLLVCPWTLSHDWQMGSVPLITNVSDLRNLVTCAAMCALFGLCYRCLLDLEMQRHTPAVVGLMLLVIPYLPASNLLVTVGFVIAERVLYIPSVGSVLLTAYGIELMWKRGFRTKKLLVLCVATLVAAGVAKTHLRNRDWRTRESLLRADLSVLPHNAKLHYNFANFLKDVEQHEIAIKHYKEALKKKNRIPEALRMLERCITLEPRFVQAYLELLLMKPDEEKRWILNKLLELEPYNWEHYLLYGNWLRGRGLLPLSLEYYRTAMRLSFSTRHNSPRGELLSLRAACLALRDTGQYARMLQLLVRWHAGRGGQPAGARLLAARAWILRSQLARRAALYSHTHRQMTSTCLHHSQLEVSPELYIDFKQQDVKPSSRLHAHDAKLPTTNSVEKNCQKTHEKSVLSAQYKPTHNKSETGHKLKSCPLNKKKERRIKDPETFPSFVSDHLIKTY
uniref:DUF1736 domain-containing protein n=1 Tax=Bombyx mori TaxID=7091 RepID=A0A8R2LZE9_BOMMO|nr:protein O-mannosyl-transferase TMTC1 isoform X2 [Bombyx mori]